MTTVISCIYNKWSKQQKNTQLDSTYRRFLGKTDESTIELVVVVPLIVVVVEVVALFGEMNSNFPFVVKEIGDWFGFVGEWKLLSRLRILLGTDEFRSQLINSFKGLWTRCSFVVNGHLEGFRVVDKWCNTGEFVGSSL